jgi:uncharacterized membrane protein YdfJ with MMPL/SSD domain
MGFGVAVALLIDATIVRSVLVPATMKLLVTRNWYLPSWLAWLPDVHVEGGGRSPRAASAPDGGRASGSHPQQRPGERGRFVRVGGEVIAGVRS